MFDGRLLAGLSRCAWKVLSLYLSETAPFEDAKPGAAIAVQSFGDFQNFNPHLQKHADLAPQRIRGLLRQDHMAVQ